MTKQQKSTYKTLYFMNDELVCYMNIMTASGNSTAGISCMVVSVRAVMTSPLRQSIESKTALDDMRNGQQFHLPFT